MANAFCVAGAIGFQIIWDPQVGQSGAGYTNLPTLSGLSCKMKVTNTSAPSQPSQTFTMTVALDGKTASYTTASPGDFPAAGIYDIAFTAVNPGDTIALSTVIVTRTVSPSL